MESEYTLVSQLPKILFLACLEDSEYASLPELESKRDNDVHGYLKTLQNPPPVVKSEYPPHGDSEYLLRSKVETSFEVENAKEDIPINFQEEVPTATLEIKFEATGMSQHILHNLLVYAHHFNP